LKESRPTTTSDGFFLPVNGESSHKDHKGTKDTKEERKGELL